MEASTAKAYLRCRFWSGKRYASRKNLCFLYAPLIFIFYFLI